MSSTSEETVPWGTAILALDVGKKRIGLAVTDPERQLILPLDTLEVSRQRDPVTDIMAIAKGREVGILLFGLPRHLNGEEGAMAQSVRHLAERLQRCCPCEITFIDERFTSVIAQQQLRSLGLQPSRDKARIDQASASIILENFLRQTSTAATRADFDAS